jgi:ribonucleoside-diphosphate reductase alpha chain
MIVLKNNKGTEDNRERKADYSVQISKIFYERYINNEMISLFDNKEVPELYNNFGLENFDNLYVAAEKAKNGGVWFSVGFKLKQHDSFRGGGLVDHF